MQSPSITTTNPPTDLRALIDSRQKKNQPPQKRKTPMTINNIIQAHLRHNPQFKTKPLDKIPEQKKPRANPVIWPKFGTPQSPSSSDTFEANFARMCGIIKKSKTNILGFFCYSLPDAVIIKIVKKLSRELQNEPNHKKIETANLIINHIEKQLQHTKFSQKNASLLLHSLTNLPGLNLKDLQNKQVLKEKILDNFHCLPAEEIGEETGNKSRINNLKSINGYLMFLKNIGYHNLNNETGITKCFNDNMSGLKADDFSSNANLKQEVITALRFISEFNVHYKSFGPSLNIIKELTEHHFTDLPSDDTTNSYNTSNLLFALGKLGITSENLPKDLNQTINTNVERLLKNREFLRDATAIPLLFTGLTFLMIKVKKESLAEILQNYPRYTDNNQRAIHRYMTLFYLNTNPDIELAQRHSLISPSETHTISATQKRVQSDFTNLIKKINPGAIINHQYEYDIDNYPHKAKPNFEASTTVDIAIYVTTHSGRRYTICIEVDADPSHYYKTITPLKPNSSTRCKNILLKLAIQRRALQNRDSNRHHIIILTRSDLRYSSKYYESCLSDKAKQKFLATLVDINIEEVKQELATLRQQQDEEALSYDS